MRNTSTWLATCVHLSLSLPFSLSLSLSLCVSVFMFICVGGACAQLCICMSACACVCAYKQYKYVCLYGSQSRRHLGSPTRMTEYACAKRFRCITTISRPKLCEIGFLVVFFFFLCAVQYTGYRGLMVTNTQQLIISRLHCIGS